MRRLVLDHHERLDGKGYPRGLKEGALDLETRILAVCDVYDALISTRVYREAWSHERAIALLEEQAGHRVRRPLRHRARRRRRPAGRTSGRSRRFAGCSCSRRPPPELARRAAARRLPIAIAAPRPGAASAGRGGDRPPQADAPVRRAARSARAGRSRSRGPARPAAC